jgi:sugar transferase (PEP-CTERM/EpsH1 system associated)
MNKDTIVICHIIYKLDYGGLENGLVNLINRMPFERYKHIIISMKHATDFRKRINRSDVELYELNKSEGKDFSIYGKMWTLLKQIRPDIVHTRNLPTLDMLVPAYLAGIRSLVHSEHGLNMTELDGRCLKYNILRWVSQFIVKEYISVSKDLANWLNKTVRIKANKISIIVNGVDTNKFYPATRPGNLLPPNFVPDNAIIIGTIGRLETVKNQISLAHAFIRILDQDPELRSRLRLIIVGDGTCMDEIKDLLEQNNASDLSLLPGFTDNVIEYYHAFDIFVLPSKREGFSNTLLEAMACGLPVVATNTGGNPELVNDNITGFLVPTASLDILAEALLRYINNTSCIDKHGKTARKIALMDYSITTMVEKYCSFYDRLSSHIET